MFIRPQTKPVDPVEFCRIYSRKKEGDWGYKSAWRRLLANVFDISESAVRQWGDNFENCPRDRRDYLATIHALKVSQQTLKDIGLDGPFE